MPVAKYKIIKATAKTDRCRGRTLAITVKQFRANASSTFNGLANPLIPSVAPLPSFPFAVVNLFLPGDRFQLCSEKGNDCSKVLSVCNEMEIPTFNLPVTRLSPSTSFPPSVGNYLVLSRIITFTFFLPRRHIYFSLASATPPLRC